MSKINVYYLFSQYLSFCKDVSRLLCEQTEMNAGTPIPPFPAKKHTMKPSSHKCLKFEPFWGGEVGIYLSSLHQFSNRIIPLGLASHLAGQRVKILWHRYCMNRSPCTQRDQDYFEVQCKL